MLYVNWWRMRKDLKCLRHFFWFTFDLETDLKLTSWVINSANLTHISYYKNHFYESSKKHASDQPRQIASTWTLTIDNKQLKKVFVFFRWPQPDFVCVDIVQKWNNSIVKSYHVLNFPALPKSSLHFCDLSRDWSFFRETFFIFVCFEKKSYFSLLLKPDMRKIVNKVNSTRTMPEWWMEEKWR